MVQIRHNVDPLYSPFQDDEPMDANTEEALQARFAFGGSFKIPIIRHCKRVNRSQSEDGKWRFKWVTDGKHNVRSEVFSGSFLTLLPVLKRRPIFGGPGRGVLVDLIVYELKPDFVEKDVKAVNSCS